MTGEVFQWYRVASHLGATVAELRRRITYSEFIGWVTFLEVEQERVSKQDFLLSQIAAEIRRGMVKDPKKVKVEDFFVRYVATKSDKENQRAKRSKSAWLAAAGIKQKV